MFSKEFNESVGYLPEVISTVDHIFTSPLIRLLDSHHQLMKFDSYLFVHDTNKPNLKRYRSELILDSGIYSEKRPYYQVFKENQEYSKQKPQNIDIKRQRQFLKEVLSSNIFKFTSHEQAAYLNRFDHIANIYAICLEQNTPWKFYQKLIVNLYDLFNLKDLSSFVRNKMVNYYESEAYLNYLTYIINRTKDLPFGILNLVKNNVFTKNIFRNIELNEFFRMENTNCLKEKILSKEIIPSYEIYLWSFFLAKIKHFGNDLGFTDRLNKFLPFNIANLQLTTQKGDGINFITFTDSISYGFYQNNMILKKPKSSRIGNIVSLYLHLGEMEMSKRIDNYFKNKEISTISMKEIYE